MSKNGSQTPTKTTSKSKPLLTQSMGGSQQFRDDDELRIPVTKTSVWLMVGLCAVALFLYIFSPILMPFVVSLGFAYVLHPLVSQLQVYGLSRSFASSIMVLVVIGLIISLVLIAFPFLRDELKSLSNTLPQTLSYLFETYVPTIKELMAPFSSDISGKLETNLMDYASKIMTWIFRVLASLFTNTLAFANIVSLIFISPILVFYLLRDWPKMIRYLETLVPSSMKQSTHTIFSDMNRALSGFFRGQTVVCLIMGVIYTLGLSIIGVNYAFTIGLISGVLTFIPYVGFFLGLVAASGVALSQFEGLRELFLVLALYGGGNLLEGFVLVPKFVGHNLGLHPLWVIFSLLGGGLLFGFMGLLLAVPVAGIVAVLVRFVMRTYQNHLSRKK